jgi:protein tyrosine phosphatase domain-containing protein 1
MQVMDYVNRVQKRRIAVHCHAGLGRTGLAIACYFVYSRAYTAEGAVRMVRQHRQGALQTSQQVLFVSVFEQYLAHLR